MFCKDLGYEYWKDNQRHSDCKSDECEPDAKKSATVERHCLLEGGSMLDFRETRLGEAEMSIDSAPYAA